MEENAARLAVNVVTVASFPEVLQITCILDYLSNQIVSVNVSLYCIAHFITHKLAYVGVQVTSDQQAGFPKKTGSQQQKTSSAHFLKILKVTLCPPGSQ